MLPVITPAGAPFNGVVSEVNFSLSSVSSVFLVAASLEVSEMSANSANKNVRFNRIK